MVKMRILIYTSISLLTGCFYGSTDERVQTETHDSTVNEFSEYHHIDSAQTTTPEKKVYEGRIKSIESAPGVIILEMETSDSQREFLFTPSLINASLFGPVRVGDYLTWNVNETDYNVYIPELKKSFEKLVFVQFTHQLPSEGIVTSIEPRPEGVYFNIRITRDSPKERHVRLFGEEKLLKPSLYPGVSVNWVNEDLMSTMITPNSVATIKISNINKSNG